MGETLNGLRTYIFGFNGLGLNGESVLVNDLALKPSVFCQFRSVRLILKLLVLLKEEGFHDLQSNIWVVIGFMWSLIQI